jgi:hypothetical protein
MHKAGIVCDGLPYAYPGFARERDCLMEEWAAAVVLVRGTWV